MPSAVEGLGRKRQYGSALVLLACVWALLELSQPGSSTTPRAQAQTGDEEPTESIEAIDDSGIEVRLDSVATGLVAPLLLTEPDDGSDRRFIVDQPGQIRILDADDELLDEPFLDLGDSIVDLDPAYDERGLLGLTFHPDYEENGRFFVYYSAELDDGAPEAWDHTSHISEFKVSEDDPDRADPDSENVILTVDQPFNNHNAGQIRFGEDGFLYIPLGDGGNGGDIDPEDDDRGRPERGNAQTTDNLLGTVLRIDVDAAAGGANGQTYAIPPDNPFVEEQEIRAEIWAYGLRNPYGFSRDLESGDFYAAEAGQALFEEVNLIESAGNYGWNIREGTACFNTENFTQPLEDCAETGYRGEPLIGPVAQYRRSPDTGSVVVPGVMYRGDELSELQGKLVFGDYSRIRFRPEGVIYLADPDAGELPWPVSEVTVSGDRDATSNGRLTRFLLGISQDLDGDIYAMTTSIGGPDEPRGAGEVFAIRAPEAETSARPLWQWAVFGGIVMLVVLGGVIFLARPPPRRSGERKVP